MSQHPIPHQHVDTSDEWNEKVVRLLTSLTTVKLFLGACFLFALGVVFVEISFRLAPPGVPETRISFLIRWTGMAFIGTASTSALLQILIVRSYKTFQGELYSFLQHEVKKQLGDIQHDIKDQTIDLRQASNSVKAIFGASASLEAIQRTSITRVYASREDASADIARDFKDADISQIRIASITLNDFIRGDRRSLGHPWEIVEEYIRGTRPIKRNGGSLDIRVLIIHPDSLGAQLRSKGEIRQWPAQIGRLQTDIHAMIKYLDVLNHEKCSDSRISFEFRLYALPPILSLFGTDKVSYIHPFYFWSSRDTSTSMPILACRDSSTPNSISLHQGMLDHFDWIWEQASIPSFDYIHAQMIGTDKGLSQSGAINVFTDQDIAKQRILWLIRNAKERLDIQGLSLHSFFQHGELYAAMLEAAQRNVRIRILVLDPDSEHAYYRSFREYLLANPPITFDEYKNKSLHENSRLYRDTRDTIKELRDIASTSRSFFPKKYRYGASCFVFLTDQTVLVEQYHYGKIVPEKNLTGMPPILGKDMALLEYARDTAGLFETDPLRNPYYLLADHFVFTFERGDPDLTDPKVTHKPE